MPINIDTASCSGQAIYSFGYRETTARGQSKWPNLREAAARKSLRERLLPIDFERLRHRALVQARPAPHQEACRRSGGDRQAQAEARGQHTHDESAEGRSGAEDHPV